MGVKMKNKILILVLFVCVAFSFVGCEKVFKSNTEEQRKETASIYTGSLSGRMNRHEIEYTGELTPKVLANGLSDITGLDFIIDYKYEENSLYIDWDLNSTLLSNSPPREEKEDFHFYDSDSTNWFMMDSLLATLRENFDAKYIYYSMDDGKELYIDELYPTNIIPSNIPYEGSTFYINYEEYIDNNTGGMGDLIPDENMSDPGDTIYNQWWGVYVNNDLGYSIEITEFTGKDFCLEVYLLRDGSSILSGRATISEDDDHLATMNDIGIYLYDDFESIDFLSSESSEWEHLRGQYVE